MAVDAAGEAPTRTGVALRLSLSTGPCSLPLSCVHQITGYATLSGEPEDYFLGWLRFRGEDIPVFDLNRVVCDRPTEERFGSRIIILYTGSDSPTQYLGLLAAGVTDTVFPEEAEGIEPLNLDLYLPMLYPLVPPAPVPRMPEP